MTPLTWARVLLGLLFIARTTAIVRWLPVSLAQFEGPLLGWPIEGKWHIGALGVVLPSACIMVLCVVRTVAAVAFTLGVKTRAAGMVAATTAFLVLSQDPFGFYFTLYALFAGVFLLALAGEEVTLIRGLLVSIYAWSAIAKMRGPWLSGDVLLALAEDHHLRRDVAAWLIAHPTARAVAAASAMTIELALGPLLLLRRTRVAAMVVACIFHAALEITMRPDVIGWVMIILLLSFWPQSETDNSRESSAKSSASS
jgi:hypothetical protein